MPLTCFRLVSACCLALALASCAPATKSAPPASSGKTASGKAAPAKTASAPTQQGFRVVMGKPLPESTGQGTPINRTPATPPQAQATPAQGAPAPAQPGQAPGQALPPSAPAPADATAATAPPAGFGGLNFGDAPHTLPGLAVHDAKQGDVVTYIWPQGPKDVFGAPIREAFYEFYKDRFYHVWINFDGMAAYKTALAEITRAYGPPTQEVPEKYYHAWMLGDVNIYCAFHPAENGGDVSYFYQPIYEPMMAARAKAAHAAKAAAPRSRKP